jgi:hypothetical protein
MIKNETYAPKVRRAVIEGLEKKSLFVDSGVKHDIYSFKVVDEFGNNYETSRALILEEKVKPLKFM